MLTRADFRIFLSVTAMRGLEATFHGTNSNIFCNTFYGIE